MKSKSWVSLYLQRQARKAKVIARRDGRYANVWGVRID